MLGGCTWIFILVMSRVPLLHKGSRGPSTGAMNRERGEGGERWEDVTFREEREKERKKERRTERETVGVGL